MSPRTLADLEAQLGQEDRIEELEQALRDVRDLIDGYVDADHEIPHGYVPNKAMRAVGIIESVLGERP